MIDQTIAREAVKSISKFYHVESEAKQNPDPLKSLGEMRGTKIGALVDSFWE